MIDLGDPFLGLKALLGLVSGSAVALAAQRAVEGRGWIAGRSACDHCQKPLGFVETTPLLGFALVGGRCGGCRNAIGWLPTIAELSGLLIWLTPAASLMGAAAQIALGLGLLYAALFDLRVLRIPNALNALLLAPSAALAILGDRFLISLVGAVLSVTILRGARRLNRRIRGRAGIGGGDIKLIGVLMLALGPQAGAWMVAAAALSAAGWLWSQRKVADFRLVHAPFLAVATWLVILVGAVS